MNADKIFDLYETNVEKLDNAVEQIQEVTPILEVFNYIKELSDFIFNEYNIKNNELIKMIDIRFKLKKFSSCSVCEMSEIVRATALELNQNINTNIDSYLESSEIHRELDED